jgi:hypothetical protein
MTVEGGPAIDLRRLVLGLFLVTVGVLFSLDELDYLELGGIWHYWPLILIGLGLSRVCGPSRRLVGLFLLVLGLWLQLHELRVLRIEDSWPLLLMAVGAVMVVSSLRRQAMRPTPGTPP